MRVNLRVRLDFADGSSEVRHVEVPAHRYETVIETSEPVLGVYVNVEEVNTRQDGTDCGCGNGPLCPLYDGWR